MDFNGWQLGLPYNSAGMVGYPRAAPEGDFAPTIGIWVYPLPTSF
jgi:hypothetical protein